MNSRLNVNIFQISDYLIDAADRNKHGEPEDKTTRKELLEAQEWADTHLRQPLTRNVTTSKGGRHRTLIKVMSFDFFDSAAIFRSF